MKAMILAAGLGTRLLPYTLKRPKPLFPILNKPLLYLTVNRIRQAGFPEIVVNAHYLSDQIKKFVEHDADIVLQEEEKVLGTGGGLRRALPNFGREPVLVVNGDIYHSINYRDVYRFHQETGSDVTLVLHEYPRFNAVTVDQTGAITGFDRQQAQSGTGWEILAFTGIHVIDPEVLKTIPADSPYSIIDCYRMLLKQGGTIRCYRSTEQFWTDIGTPEDYLKLHEDLLKMRVPVYEELLETAAEGPFVGLDNISSGREVKFLDWVCIGSRVSVGAGAVLQRCIIWDQATVEPQALVQDAIVAP